MKNANFRLLIGSGMVLAGVVLIGTTKLRRKRSLFALTRKQAGILADQARRKAVKLGDAAADAGKAAYQRVAG